MTYLQLINNVLTRLREDVITAAQINANPYLRFIGTAVNDAKDRVEDSWNWSSLRGSDLIDLNVPPSSSPGDFTPNYQLPNSADNHYIINGFYWADTDVAGGPFYPLRQITKGAMIRKQSIGANAIPVGAPTDVAVNRTDPVTGNITVVIHPEQDTSGSSPRTLIVDRVAHQDPLTGALNERLLVPSLPVYTLATALASRERGEVGGTPTSELFAIADRHLSDAIAQDSALFADELDWYSAGGEWHNTNVRTA